MPLHKPTSVVQAMPITPSSRNNRHLILFNVAPYHFCAPAAEVESMIMVPPVSRLPLAPPSVIGLINHRGQVYRVISLRRKLGLETGPSLLQGQLILTSLSTGLTAFLVDEVVDVLPDTDLPRHALSPHSAMDLFDAFILRDELVLFHTTFNMLEQAREVPYPSPDLKTTAHMADDVRAHPPTTDPSSTEHERLEVKATETDGTTACAEKSIHRTGHPNNPGTGPAAKTTPPTAATPMSHAAANDPTFAISRPSRRKPAQQRAISSTPHRRARRYALTLMVVLILLLIVALSSVLLLQQRRSTSRAATDGKTPPLPVVAVQPEGIGFRQKSSRPQPSTAEKPAPPAEAKPAAIAAVKPKAAESIENDGSPSQPTIPMPSAPAPASAASREIMRVETEKFTLMVERPTTEPIDLSPPLSHRPPPATNEIVHQVVPGDTLWDIAAHYLDDPFQYPELARLSQIRNPHLIYPGDIIHIIRKER
jgi:chemotaxis signal transduction protein